MKRLHALLALASVAVTPFALGCGGGDADSGSTGFKQNTSSSTGAGAGGGGACPIFPGDNWWNTDVSTAPVDANSDAYVAFIDANGGDGPLHADFDAVGDGIPFAFVDASVPKVKVSFDYADESDKGPYPIPANPPVENGGDRHVILVDESACELYELFAAADAGGSWHAGSGAIFDLTSDALRPDCWTSADAAGLPIFPGLVRYAEVEAGEIAHALRFTVDVSQEAWIKPARHEAGSETSAAAPPMGLRLRLKSTPSVNAVIASAGPQPKVVLRALQRYGMFVADNGSNWFVSGEPNKKWNDDDFHAAFDQLHGTDFEVVDTGEKIERPSSCP
ncbi:MAG TPA: hypothetical protein VHB21_18945 [Minicystis sp.]|nr:hypothetical protein [Minicystis sp.]